jgi:hypothetical protein
VLSNSNGNTTQITLASGTKTVFSVYPAERAIVVDGSTIQIPNSAVLPLANGGTGSSTAAFSGSNITDLNATAITAGTISNARTTASSSNGASSIVERDATGNFSANVITANGSSITSINAANISSGTLGVANGGTGAATLTANNVILGNGTSSVLFVAPGTSSNVLTSNGTTWVSQAPSGGGVGSVAAWVNFNGTGSISIRDSDNVTSLTDNNVGNYTVNFTNAIANATYAVTGSAHVSDGAANDNLAVMACGVRRQNNDNAFQTGSINVFTNYSNSAFLFDARTVCVAIITS